MLKNIINHRLDELKLSLYYIKFIQINLALQNKNTTVFIAYVDEDRKILNRLIDHLSVLKENYSFEIWHKGLLIKEENKNRIELIKERLRKSKITILLVSSKFLASEDYASLKKTLVTLPNVKVVPILTSPCSWKEDNFLKQLSALPTNGVYLTDKRGNNRDKLFLEITNSVKGLLTNSKELSGNNFGVNLPAKKRKRKQLWAILGSLITAIALVSGLWSDLPVLIRDVKLFLGKSENDKSHIVENDSFEPIFPPTDSSSFNILIIRFEDYIANKETECIGRAILEHLNVIKANEKLNLPINARYVADTIPPPESKEQALEIQKRHNADLIIYGLARKVQEDCGGADVCFRYSIADEIVTSVAPEVEKTIGKHDIDFVSTSPIEIEEGNFKVDKVALKSWLSALINIKSGDPDEAIYEILSIGNGIGELSNNEKLIIYTNRARAFSDLKQYNKVIETYDKIIEIDSLNSTWYNNRGVAYCGLKKYEIAINDYNKSIELKMNDNDNVVYFNRANIYHDLQKNELALIDINIVLGANPKDKYALYTRGEINYDLKKYSSAFEDFMKFAEIDGNRINIYYIVNNLFVETGEDSLLKQLYDTIVEKFPNEHVGYYLRGRLYKKMNDYDSAISDYKKAIDIQGESDYYSALIYAYMAKYDKLPWVLFVIFIFWKDIKFFIKKVKNKLISPSPPTTP